MDLSDALKQTSLYSELRWQTNRSIRIGIRDGDLIINQESNTSGVSCRSWDRGQWGMAFSSRPEELKRSIEKAHANAHFMASKNQQSAPVQFQPNRFEYIKPYSCSHQLIDQKEMIDFAKQASEYISGQFSDLKSHQLFVIYLELEKNLSTTEGSRAHHHLPRTLIACEMFFDRGGEVVSLMEFDSCSDRPNAHFLDLEKLKPKLHEQYDRVKEKAEGVFPEAGLKDVIIGSSVTGVLVHEAIGHPSEADLVDAGAVTKNYLNKKVGSELVTMVDFAHSFNGEELPVPVYIDDEGTKAEDVTIIENGVFKQYMTNRETSEKFTMPASGNARAYGFDDEPLIRMRNTVLLPGSSSLEEMIGSIDDGYYFTHRSNGQADLTSEFMFGVPFGYEIKNGKLGRALKDSTISGVAFDMLDTIDMVGNDFEVHSVGMCGKKQPMVVSHGGPSVKCQVAVGGQ